jgi:hypothetical protein
VVDECRARGIEVTYDWTAADEAGAETWTPERRSTVAKAEITGAALATHLIFILPGGRGAHAELGAALASGAQVLLVGAEPAFSLFYHHVGVRRLDGDPTPSEILDEMAGVRGEHA